MNRSLTGFTLLELLITLSIVSILLAILFPTLVHARNRSKEATCISNVSQIGKAVHLYAADYDDYLPNALACSNVRNIEHGKNAFSAVNNTQLKGIPSINDALRPYSPDNRVYCCPLDRINPIVLSDGESASTYFELEGSSYGYMDSLGIVARSSLTSLSYPAQTVLFWDVDDRFHGGFRVALLADGHVKKLSPAEQPGVLRME